MQKYLAIGVAALTVPLALFGMMNKIQANSAFVTPHGAVAGWILIAMLLAQLPALWLRQWGWSLGAAAMAVAFIVLEITVLDPPESCGPGCVIVRKADA